MSILEFIFLAVAEARTSPEDIFQEFISKYGGAGSHLNVGTARAHECPTQNDVGFHLLEAFETDVEQVFVALFENQLPQKNMKSYEIPCLMIILQVKVCHFGVSPFSGQSHDQIAIPAAILRQ